MVEVVEVVEVVKPVEVVEPVELADTLDKRVAKVMVTKKATQMVVGAAVEATVEGDAEITQTGFEMILIDHKSLPPPRCLPAQCLLCTTSPPSIAARL